MPDKSIIHTSFDGRNMRPLICGEDYDIEDFSALEKMGIAFDTQALMRMMQSDPSFGMDSIQQPLTTPSIPNIVQFLQNWLPGFVKIITAARKIDDIVGMATTGSWEDEEIVQPVIENLGAALPYGDTTNTALANWNVNFNTRTVVRMETGMRVGNMEEARAARIRVNSGEAKRESAAQLLEISRNMIGFFGYNSGNNNTYGLLNDPSLPAYIQVASGVGGRLWSQKTAQEIMADLRTAIVGLRTNSQDTIDPEKTPLTLAIATNSVDYLSAITDFGISVRDWLTQTYKNVRVTSAPQFNSANGGFNVFYLFADRVEDISSDDGRAFIQVVPTKFRLNGVQKLTKGYEESYSNATAGIMTKRPYAVYRAYNI